MFGLRGRLDDVRLSWAEWLKVAVPLILVVTGVFAFTWHFVRPAPPSRIVMAAGVPGGVYDAVAREYASYFATQGFELVVKESAGSIDNYKMLLDENSGVDMALVQGGTAPEPGQRHGVRAVCSVYFEPLWIFYRNATPVTHLTQFAGKRLAIGPAGSGVRALAEGLLRENGVGTETDHATVLSDPPASAAGDLLAEGKVDAAFLVSGPENPLIRQLMQMSDVQLMSFPNADAYARRSGYLSHVTLYEGSLDLAKDLPKQDVQLVAPAAMIVSRATTHTGIVELIVQAATKTHANGTLFNGAGVFPSTNYVDLKLDGDAVHFLKTPPSFLHRSLPFWAASLIDRTLILLLPSIAVLLPLLRLTPIVYRWRMRSRIYRWYTQLRRIDAGMLEQPTPEQLARDHHELVSLDRELSRVKVPLSFMQELYNLRLHVAYLHGRIEPMLAKKSG